MTIPRHVVLVGLMATGKSTVGRLLAARLGRPLVDTDDVVERAAGMTVRELWASEGEPAFRARETAALRAALAGTPSVVAGAGGVVLADENRALLSAPEVLVVWLRADVDTLLARVAAAGDAHRPLLDRDPAAALRAMAQNRTARYEEVADLVIDVDDRSPDEVATAIADQVTGATPGSRR